MARDFHARFAAARDVFAEASDALDLDLAALCFEQDPRLEHTEFTQPALLTAELAMFRALQHEVGLAADCFGGHSLGEYTALCAAGALPLAVAVRLVRHRGALMQRAVPVGEGAMTAVIAPGIGSDDLGAERFEVPVDVANRNSPNQLVISGSAAGVAIASGRLGQRLRDVEHQLVPLEVSAPFHSRLMQPIEPAFRAQLEAVGDRLTPARAAAVTSNFTGTWHQPALPALLDALTRQISGTVEWVANMRVLASASDRIYEIGPGRPLRGFFKALGHDITSVLTVKAIEKGLP